MKIKSLLIVALLFLMGQVVRAQGVYDLNQGAFFEGFEDASHFENYWTTSDLLINSYYGIVSGVAHGEGSKSFRFGHGAGMGNIGYLISPKFIGTGNGVHVEFYYTNYYNKASTFQVGYSTSDVATIENFTWGETIQVPGGDTWREYTHDFPVNITYIAIKFPKASSYLYVDDFTFETSTVCLEPSDFLADEVIPRSVTLSWAGNSSSYELQYIPILRYSFESSDMDSWTTIDADGLVYTDGNSYAWKWGDIEYIANSGQGGHVAYGAYEGSHCVYSESNVTMSNGHDYVEVNLHPDNYLVSPLVPLGGSISFYAKGHDPSAYQEHFGVAVSTSENPTASDFENNMIAEWKATNEWTKYTVDLSNYADQWGYVAIRHFECADGLMALDVDYVVIFLESDWTSVSVTENTCTIDNLEPQTYYAIRVRGVCDGGNHSSWTDNLDVLTPMEERFETAGDWCDENNWSSGAVPTANSYVTIAANVVVPDGCVASAKHIVVNEGNTLTIEDGGQLKHDNVGVLATVEKNINAYSNEYDNYYLLASPMANELNVESNTNLATNNYDLYKFDQSQDLEWRFYGDNQFAIANTAGYLYANNVTMTATMTGQLMPSNDNVEVDLNYDNAAVFKGWNLVGNPFACTAYILGDVNFYKIDGNELQAASGVVAPCEGVFVKADNDDESVTFTRIEPQGNCNSILNLNIVRSGNRIDVARIRFGEGRSLEKFMLNPNHTKVYISQDGRDYAVIHSESTMGELPVSFKAEESGKYTLGFTTENVEFSYLHLIDNITGNDVNLLQTPSYTFEANTTDYANRFKLVFVTGSSIEDDSFGFIHNGHLLVLGNEGEATLQVIDLMGRMMSSERFNGSYDKPINVAAGVYLLRLINGNDVKVQRIVVR